MSQTEPASHSTRAPVHSRPSESWDGSSPIPDSQLLEYPCKEDGEGERDGGAVVIGVAENGVDIAEEVGSIERVGRGRELREGVELQLGTTEAGELEI